MRIKSNKGGFNAIGIIYQSTSRTTESQHKVDAQNLKYRLIWYLNKKYNYTHTNITNTQYKFYMDTVRGYQGGTDRIRRKYFHNKCLKLCLVFTCYFLFTMSIYFLTEAPGVLVNPGVLVSSRRGLLAEITDGFFYICYLTRLLHT